MKLAEATWPDIDALSRDVVFVIPTGSLEQHGPHLPLFTDTLIVTAVAEAVEGRLHDAVVLTPTLWLGASAHHLAFPGTLSASFSAYGLAIESAVDSLTRHGFRKFYLLNGHGGNDDPNGVAARTLKANHPNAFFGRGSYYEFARSAICDALEGPLKEMRHACEAETSLMMHLHPSLVRLDKLRDDGLQSEPAIRGAINHFDEITEQGSFGFATRGSTEKGKVIFEAAVHGVVEELRAVSGAYCFRSMRQ